MRIAVLTSLYPSSVRPFEGIFVERRWTGMLARGHVLSVIQPLPRAPFSFGRKSWAELGRMQSEARAGIEIDRPRFLHLPKRTRANARAFASRGLERILLGPVPDVVVADYAWPAARAACTLARRGIPFVISGRGSDVLEVAGEAGLAAELSADLRTAGHWCAVSRDLLESMDRLGGRPGRGVLVPNGVDTELFFPRDRGRARERLGLDTEETLVLCVGHLIERKDPILVLDAWVRWVERARRPARLVFIGEGPLFEPLRDRVAGTGREQQVTLIPRTEPSELAHWYAAADLLMLASWREGRPNVVLEALASGRPVLATKGGGTAELLEGLEGMLAPSRDPRDLAERMQALLARAPAPEVLAGQVQRSTWDASLDALEGCLHGAVQETRAT